MKRLMLWSVPVMLSLAGCGGHEPPKDAVAVVGDRAIDVLELNRSYQLHPQWKRGQTELQSYLTQLSALITQKVYAQEAEKLGMDRDSLMRAYLQFLKEKEMIKGLYRRQVRENVRITEGEERRMYEWMKKHVDYEYVYAQDSSRCAQYADALRKGGPGSLVLPPDSSVKVGTRKDGAVDRVPRGLERFLFTGSTGDISGPTRVEGGFMAAKITGGTVNTFEAENDFIAQKQSIDKLLTERKADSLANHYVVALMRDKGLKLNPKVFWQVAEYFWQRVKEAHVDQYKMQTVYVTGDEIRLLSVDLHAIGKDMVATHRDGGLTVNELLSALEKMPGSLRPRVRTPQNLKDAIGGIVRNQYLLKEAAREGLADDPDVLYEYDLQRDETLATAYYARRRAETDVTPEEVEAFKKRAPVSEEQVFFKFNMASLARDAKVDTLLLRELPALERAYNPAIDTARVRALLKTPDAVINQNPIRMYVREIFM
jgi:hypothetical protein